MEASTLVSKSGEPYFEVVNRCQEFLASIVLEGSVTKRYHFMLTQLQRKARKVAYRSDQRHEDFVPTSTEGQANVPANSMAVIGNGEPSEDPNYVQQVQDVDSNGNAERSVLRNEFLDMESIVDFNTEHLSWGFIDQMGRIPDPWLICNSSY